MGWVRARGDLSEHENDACVCVRACTWVCVRVCGGGGVQQIVSHVDFAPPASLLVVWRFCCLDGLQEDFNLWWQCLSESFPSLPVYFGSGGGLEDLRISGFFAHVNDKMYICVYISLYFHVLLPFFFFFFPPPLLIIPIMCKYCNLSHNFCNLPLYLLVKIVSCFDSLIE